MEEKTTSKQLTVEEIKLLWSKTYSAIGKPDWSHLFPYYDDSIIFQDSIQRIVGIDKFKAMCNRLAKRCRSLEMNILNIIEVDNIVMMEWKMTMSFRVFPKKPIFGASRLTFNNQGKIVEQRDYYDLWGDIYDGIPIYRRIYRWFMRVFFG
ncbi:MAG TPA: nuclear transport factor 2 family protein [Bacilli bacterium]|nr:nuclear transport factor 2 family protein [Bacilli bacterium]